MNSLTDRKSSYSLFGHEERVLAESKSVIDQVDNLDNPLLDPLVALRENYQKMLRQLVMLTRTADKQQYKLTETNKKLESANREITLAQQEAESANAAKTKFLAHMSHELRTPLNGILGYAQILMRDETLDHEQKHHITVVRQSGEHLLQLINDILDLTRVDAGKIELFSTKIKLQTFISQMTDLIKIRTDQEGLHFECRQLTDLPAGVCADEKRLRQIVLNLLSNAVKYTPNGSIIWNLSYQNGILRMTVEDTGFGISEEDLPHITEAFKQVGDQRHTIEGAGLGLPITKKLVELMGGTLRVSSELCKGSCFEVDLPLPRALMAEDPVIATPYSDVVGYQGSRIRILVADDKTSNREILTKLLAPIGFDIVEACNGQEVIEQAESFHPNLILLDLVMPEMDGYETARRLRESVLGQTVKIIVISASVLEFNQTNILEAGCDAFIPKPVEASDLFEIMGELLPLEWITRPKPVLNQDEAALDIIPPPPEKMEELNHLVLSGDMSGIVDFSHSLIEVDTNFRPFANVLIKLAKSFQDKKLQAFFDQFV